MNSYLNVFRAVYLSVLIVLTLNCSGKISKFSADEKCVSYFNIILKGFDENNNLPIFEKVLYERPHDFDTSFYDSDNTFLSRASFFISLIKEHKKETETLYLFIDTSDFENGYSKFYLLNEIYDKYYISDGYSFYSDFRFLANCDLEINEQLIADLNPKPAFNTYNTNLFGAWRNDNDVNISFEEHYYIYKGDSVSYEKLGDYLLDKESKDTLLTIRAISRHNLILEADFINNGEMLYYKKTIMHHLSLPRNENDTIE